ncbi:membrane protein, inferred for ABFAE pathway [Minicystis rosea]|nr:membrane protein, inferred for ABFAE pathway [Minicystis rosea]
MRLMVASPAAEGKGKGEGTGEGRKAASAVTFAFAWRAGYEGRALLDPSFALRRRVVALVLAVATIGSALAVMLGLRLEPNVASLLPDRGEAAALRRYVRGFGGSDLAVVMVAGANAEENAEVARKVAEDLGRRPTVKRAADHADLSRPLDPMVAWRYADHAAQERLARALTPEGMRERLRESRALLLAPGSGALADVLAQDPLRLAQLAFEGAGLGGGMKAQPDGGFANDDGTMRLVLIQPRGQALRGADAKAFVADVNAVLDPLARAHPAVSLGLTGGHAIAAATEAMLSRDLSVSGTLAMILASLAFIAVFRRMRALVAVMPPLVLGTLWTAGLAAALPGGLSAIAVAFTSVVVGVGVDTGVHVYAALLDARREGLAPLDAARAARRKTTRAVLTAAFTAAAAFGALALSDINAVRQLGILCALGEVLTAVAIIAVTPEIGAFLERGAPPPEAPSRWTTAVAWLTATRPRAAFMAALALAPIVALIRIGPPPLADAIVGVRPQRLAPLLVQQKIFDAFGGKRGQLVVLVADRDLESARERTDRLVDRLGRDRIDLETVDALTSLAPAARTQRDRYAARDALDLPKRADDLERALAEVGFAPARFTAALEGMRHPTHDIARLDDLSGGPASILASRYLGRDEGDHLIALYLQTTAAEGSVDRLRALIAEVDPAAMLTGYARLDASLRATLARDLPLIGFVAGILVIAALAASLRRARDVALACLVVAAEIAAVLVLIRILHIPLHAYAALVLPVLLGITVDEGMFLLHHAREATIADTLRREGPPVAATALTTAAGFAALGLCDFDGLRDLGWVGALGSVVGLVVALLVVPAGLRLSRAARD